MTIDRIAPLVAGLIVALVVLAGAIYGAHALAATLAGVTR